MTNQPDPGINDNAFYYITSISSVISGIFGKLVCHPLDTMRAKLQVQRDVIQIDEFKNHRLINTMKQTIKNEGIRGFYKGLGISLIGTGPAFSLYLTVYEIIKTKLQKNQFMAKHQGLGYFIAGLTAEAVSCIFWLPIDVIKERMQVQNNLKIYNYKNTMDAIQTIRRTEGLIGLYRAYGATLASFGPYSAIFFLLYEELKQYQCLNPQKPLFMESIILSALAGSIAGTIVNPLEVQRANNASGGQSGVGNFGYRNLPHGLGQILQNEGVASLWKGSMAKILYNAPNTAIAISLAEFIRIKLIGLYKNNTH